MGKINLHNYEVFLIDYFDGNLSEDTIADLRAFVLANPQLEIDLSELKLPNISNEFLSLEFKDRLKKTVAFIDDEQIINYIENKLFDPEKQAFETSLLENKELKKQHELYSKTILQQDFSILFPSKTNLHKNSDNLILNNKVLAYFENQLKGADKLQFEQELKGDNHLQKELSLYNSTKLNPDKDLVFYPKNNLKKDTKVIVLFSLKRVLSAAAAILLLIGLAVIFNATISKPSLLKEMANKQLNKKDNSNQQLIGLGHVKDTLHQFVGKKENTIAQKNSSRVKNNSTKKVSINVNALKTSSLVIANKSQLPDSFETNKIPVDGKLFIAKSPILADTISSKIVNADLNQTKQNYLIAEEVEAEEEELVKASSSKKGFWQYATKIAKRVNKLGVKSINGEETSEQNYSLSFNAFSVEKR